MAAGDFVVRRNASNTDALPDTDGGTLDCVWDTAVANEGSGITHSSGTFTLGETGRFLVAASDQWGTTDTTANERTTSVLQAVLAGTLLVEGADSEYLRRSGGSQEGICSLLCYVNVATTTGNGDELIVRHTRRDNSAAGTVNRIADRSGVSIVKLDDSWNFAHYRSSAAYTPSASDHTRNQADIGSTVEQDGSVFSRSGNVVTVTTDQPVLVMWTHQLDQSDTKSGRSEYQGSIDFAGSELAVRGWNQVYGPRATDNANNASMSGATLIYPNGTGQALELNLISREDADEDWFTELQLVELPAGAETATVERTTAAGNFNAAGTDFAFQAGVNVDTAAFTYSDGNANIEVDNADDYFALANMGTVTDAGYDGTGTRAVPAIQFRVNTTDSEIAGASSYNRNNGTAEHAHAFISGLLTGLSATDDVYVRADRVGTNTNTLVAVGGFSLIRLSSLFGAAQQDITPAAETVTATPGGLTVTTGSVAITPAAETVTATPGGLTVTATYPVTPAAVTVTATPGGLTVTPGSVGVTPDPLTVTATPGGLTVTTGPVAVTPDPTTVTVTPGAPTITAGAAGVTPDPLTVTVTPSGLTVTSTYPVTPAAVSVTATPGDVSVTQPQSLTPAAVTVTATPGGLTVTAGSVAVTPDPITVTATPGGLTVALAQTMSPADVTVTATPGGLSVAAGAVAVTPDPITVTATPGGLTVQLTQDVTPDPTTVTATAGTVAVTSTYPVTPDPLTVTATPGGLTVTSTYPVTPAAVTVTATPGGLTVAVGAAPVAPAAAAVNVTPGTLTLAGGSQPVVVGGTRRRRREYPLIEYPPPVDEPAEVDVDEIEAFLLASLS